MKENKVRKPWVANMSEKEAVKLEPNDRTVVISITEPGRIAKFKRGWNRRGWADLLRLQFHDFDSNRHTVAEWQKHWCDPVLCTQEQANRIAAFATKHRGKNIIVHCAAGVSRSGATCEAILAAFPEYEDRGRLRFPNGMIRALLNRAFGITPIGWKENDNDISGRNQVVVRRREA